MNTQPSISVFLETTTNQFRQLQSTNKELLRSTRH